MEAAGLWNFKMVAIDLWDFKIVVDRSNFKMVAADLWDFKMADLVYRSRDLDHDLNQAS